MREFNLDEAKQGAKVCLRDGRPAKIEDFNDRNAFHTSAMFPILTTFWDHSRKVRVHHSLGGNYLFGGESPFDLMMAD